MANNEQVENLDFNALVTLRAGSKVRKVQEEYLVRTLMAVVAERTKNRDGLSDHEVLKALGIDKTDDVYATIKMAGSSIIYAAVAKMLLDDPSQGLDTVRVEVAKRIHEAINRDKEIRQEANI